MIVGVIGSGGREHSICEALHKSKNVEKIFCFPGNAGTAISSESYENGALDFEKLKKFILNKLIELIIVGKNFSWRE